MPHPPRIAIVTGVSRHAGLGAAIARSLAADGWALLLTGPPERGAASRSTAAEDSLEAVARTVEAAARAASAGAVERPGEEAGHAAGAAIGERAGVAAGDAAGERAGGDAPPIATVEADLRDPAAARFLVDACHERLGAPSALVNNAAFSARGSLDALDAAALDEHWQVNARAPALLVAAFARRFSGTSGSIVNLTSGQGLSAMPGETAYAMSKGALETLTLQAAAELAPRGIRVNAVDPGPTDTGWMTPAQRVAFRAPLGRVGEATDAARLVCFLCSDESRWITGQILRSRGGL